MLSKIFAYFKKFETVVVLLSVCLTLFISGVVGLGAYLLIGKFLGPFVIAFALQVILFAIVNTRQIKNDQFKAAKLYNERLQAISKFVVRLSCAYCKVSNSVPIHLNNENRFKCEGCNQVNGIKMQFITTQITTPLDKIVLPVSEENATEIKIS
jgi:hypothetical protein